jgi:hypothetical protein
MLFGIYVHYVVLKGKAIGPVGVVGEASMSVFTVAPLPFQPFFTASF